MLKAIIFDFDGVIAESVEVKIEAFRRLFAEFPEHLPEIIEYHKTNGGISRYVKFRYIYEKILKKPLSEAESQRLGGLFSQYALEEVIAAPFVAGAEEFLTRYHQKLLLFVVSGTPEEEMRLILEKRHMVSFFKGVYGSPRSKAALITTILKDNQLLQEEAVFIGDSINDYDGAMAAGIRFIGRLHPKEGNPFPRVPLSHIINNINELEAGLRKNGLL